MTDCLFCKIAAHEAPATFRFEDDEVMAFDDIYPKAPIHILIVPKQHEPESMNVVQKEHSELLIKLFDVARNLAAENGCDTAGYKLLFNVGEGGGQSVPHLHLHLIGKRNKSDTINLTTA